MRKRIAALFDKCRVLPLGKISVAVEGASAEERKRVGVLLRACGDFEKADFVSGGIVSKRLGGAVTTRVDSDVSIRKRFEAVVAESSVAGRLLAKLKFDEALIFCSGDVPDDLITLSFNAFAELNLKCCDRHVEAHLSNLFSQGRWEDAVGAFARQKAASPKTVDVFLVSLQSLQWTWALALKVASRSTLTSRSASAAALIALNSDWMLALRILSLGPSLSPRDGYEVQKALSNVKCSWTACLQVLEHLVDCRPKNAILAAGQLARRGQWRFGIGLLSPFVPLCAEAIGYVVLQAQFSERTVVLELLSFAKDFTCDDGHLFIHSLTVLFASLDARICAIRACRHKLETLVRYIAAHASCCGTESFEEYRLRIRHGNFCTLSEPSQLLGVAAAKAELRDDEEVILCSAVARFLDPLQFWKSFSV